MTADFGTPAGLLSPHPETAYFWGRVAGDGVVYSDSVTVRADEETVARQLAAIADAERVTDGSTERSVSHDTVVTRIGGRYAVRLLGDIADDARSILGLPVRTQSGEYWLGRLGCDRQLLRGIFEGCGVVCFKSPNSVGLSFVHSDARLLEWVDDRLDALGVPAPTSELSRTTTDDYWFSVDDDAAPAVCRRLYDGSESTGLFAPGRRRKLLRSLERAKE